MNSFLDKLNLRPQERRLFVLVAAIVFVLLNVWFVWPHFDDWRKIKTAHVKALETLVMYKAEAASIPPNKTLLARLEEEGATVVQEDQVALRTVQNQASQRGVIITRQESIVRSTNNKTNEFFEEQSLKISVQTGEKELVDFLYSLGEGNSMIRVRDMDLKPDGPQQKLNGTLTLVASYLKKPAPPPAPAPAVKTSPSNVRTNTTPARNPPGPASTNRGGLPPPPRKL